LLSCPDCDFASQRSRGPIRILALSIEPSGRTGRDPGEATCGLGDFEAARALLNESLRILERLGDRRIVAMCVNNLAAVDYEQREFASSRGQFAMIDFALQKSTDHDEKRPQSP
jgi:hypothetical protein